MALWCGSLDSHHATLKVPASVSVFLFLRSAVAAFEVAELFQEAFETLFKPPGKYPAFSVACFPVESANVVDDAEPAHFGADGFERAAADAMFVRDGFEYWKELAGRPF